MPKCSQYKGVSGIYKIQNKINRHIYIGQASDIYKRWKDYDTRPFNPKELNYNTTICKAIRKYGINSFEFTLIEVCPITELDEKEIYWINYYDTYYHGYNETFGGRGSAGHGNKIDKEEFKKLCQDLIEDVISPDIIAKKYNITLDTLTQINYGKLRKMDGYSYPLRIEHCPICGGEKKSFSSVMCTACATKIKSKINIFSISKEELKKLIYKYSFEYIGKQLGVSPASIRRWCKKYGLPHLREEIIYYSPQEWDDETFDIIPYIPHKAKEIEMEIVTSFQNGTSRAEIKNKYNLSYLRINSILEKHKKRILDYEKLMTSSFAPQNIYQLDQQTLQIIKQYNSITDAEKEFGHSTVQPCLKGKHRTAGGYKWILCSSVPDLTIRDIVPEDKLPKYIRKTKTNREGE